MIHTLMLIIAFAIDAAITAAAYAMLIDADAILSRLCFRFFRCH